MLVIKSIFRLSLFLIIILVIATPGLAQGPLPQTHPTSPAFAPGEIIVKFQPHVGLLGAQSSLRVEGLRPLETARRTGSMRVKVPAGQEAETIAELMARGDVEYASLNYIVEALGDPNDSEYWRQWSLKQPQDHDIDAPEAWDFFTGGSNITIAVIDTGVDLDHLDLQGKIVPGYDFVNDDTIPDDDHGHGTHVAGIAAASSNNGIGIAGVSWEAKIMPLKVLDASGSGSTFDMADAIRYAVDNGAQVINMSLGAKYSTWPCDWPHVEEALNYAVSNNVLVVVAAGNDGQYGVNCPGAYDQVMAVGSTTSTDTRSYFSNYGPRLDIAAPGSSIYSTIRGGSYGYMSGTSMSTPHVAGLAALIWSFIPSYSSSQVRSAIQNSADDLGDAGWDQYFGYGRINAWRALESVSLLTSPDELVLLLDDETGSVSGNIQVTTANPETINWTATISPAVTWLELTPPSSGTVTVASPNSIPVLATTNGITYAIHTATVVVTGTTPGGEQLGPNITQVKLHYVPKIYRYRFPIILKQGSLP